MCTHDELWQIYLEVFSEPADWEKLQKPNRIQVDIGPIAIQLQIVSLRRDGMDGDWRITVIPVPTVSDGFFYPLNVLWKRRGSTYAGAAEAFVDLRKYLLGLAAAITLTCGMDENPTLLHPRPRSRPRPQNSKKLAPDVVNEIVGDGHPW